MFRDISVEYIDHMGDDLRVVNAARVSFGKHVTEFNERDRKLVGYLSEHNHFTPFCHTAITLRECVPIFVARQRFKHTVGFSYNEVSRRYVDNDPEFFEPTPLRKRGENVKQGSSAEIVHMDEELRHWIKLRAKEALRDYQHMLSEGVCPEQARMILPQSMMTEYYVTGSLAAFARAYGLRADSHAQSEIRDLAAEWDRIIRPLFPAAWEALTFAEPQE